jgi:hypothetical protein
MEALERRRQPRVPWHGEVTVQAGTSRVRCEVVDLSETGMCVVGCWGAYPGQSATLRFDLRGHAVHAFGTVVWTKQGHAGHTWGIRFTALHRNVRKRIAAQVSRGLRRQQPRATSTPGPARVPVRSPALVEEEMITAIRAPTPVENPAAPSWQSWPPAASHAADPDWGEWDADDDPPTRAVPVDDTDQLYAEPPSIPDLAQAYGAVPAPVRSGATMRVDLSEPASWDEDPEVRATPGRRLGRRSRPVW